MGVVGTLHHWFGAEADIRSSPELFINLTQLN